MGFIVTIILIFAIIGSIAAWVNTRVILKELQTIKEHLNIKEEKESSFMERDIDYLQEKNDHMKSD